MIKKGKKRLMEEAAELEKNRQKHTKNAQVFLDQLAELNQSKAKDDEVLNQQVNNVLDSLPDTSAKGLVEKVLHMKTGKSAQLVENIEKITLAAQNEQRKAGIAELELRKVKNDIKELDLNGNAQAAGDEINTFLEKYKVLQNYFENEFKSVINQANMSNPKWPARLKNLGFSPPYEIVGVSFLKGANLGSLSIEGLIERIQNLRGYGPPLLNAKDKNLQPVRPVQRDTYFGYEKP